MADAGCPTPEALLAFARTPDLHPAVEDHLAGCDICRRALSQVLHTSGASPSGDGRSHAATSAATLLEVEPTLYEIVGTVGRGGMGRVLAARDRRLGRQVAIKELLADTPERRARFEREVRLTARLQHPAIVTVLEAGTWPSGEPFYVMQYVGGESLASAIRRRESLDERLALVPSVIAATDALAYAHAQRIIHRDLKPENVLIGEFGETVVIDWGLAKDLDAPHDGDAPGAPTASPASAGATVAGAVVGTPAYMPREQAQGGAIDERADVYALGAMLYHVLAGVPPHAAPSPEALLARLAVEAPTPLARVAPGMPRDLATIVERAMAPKPEARYPSARALADDLKRFQTGQLVASHHYSLTQRVGRWVRRRRALVAVALAAAVVLATVSLVSIRRIVREKANVSAALALAEARGDSAEVLLDFMLGDLTEQLEPIGKIDLLGTVARKALDYYRDAEVDPQRRSKALLRLGAVFVARGDTVAAAEAFQESLALAHQLAAAQPAGAAQLAGLRLQAQAHERLAFVLEQQGRLADALEHARAGLSVMARVVLPAFAMEDLRSLAVAERRLSYVLMKQGALADALAAGERAVATAVAITARGEPQVGDLDLLARSHAQLGNVHDAANAPELVLPAYRAAHAIYLGLLARALDDARWMAAAVECQSMVAAALLYTGHADDALVELQASRDLARRLVASDPSHRGYARSLLVLLVLMGDVLRDLERFDEARTTYLEAQRLGQDLVARDPKNTAWRRDLAVTDAMLGETYLALGDAKAALEALRSAHAQLLELLALEPDVPRRRADIAASHEAIATALASSGDTAGARLELEKALALLEGLLAAAPGDLAQRRTVLAMLGVIGSLCQSADRQGEAASWFLRQVTVARDGLTLAGAPDEATLRRDLAGALTSLGEARCAGGAHDEGLAAYREAQALLAALAPVAPDDAERAAALAKATHGFAACARHGGHQK